MSGMSVLDLGTRLEIGDWVTFGDCQAGRVKYFSTSGKWVYVKENGNGKMLELLVRDVCRVEVEVAA